MFKGLTFVALLTTFLLVACSEEEVSETPSSEIEVEATEDKPSPEEVISLRNLEAEITESNIGLVEYKLCPVTLGAAKASAYTGSAPLARTDPNDDSCEKDPQACWQSCKADVDWACRDLANLLENKLDGLLPILEVDRRLYARACALGEPNACTNRAAGIVNARADFDAAEPLADEKRAQCTMTMFEAACAKDEYWGCSQVGIESGENGHESVRNLERSAAAFRKSCQINAREKGNDASHC